MRTDTNSYKDRCDAYRDKYGHRDWLCRFGFYETIEISRLDDEYFYYWYGDRYETYIEDEDKIYIYKRQG